MDQPRIALLIETSLGYGRGLLRGIVEYARHYGPWSFYVAPGDLVQRVPKLVE
ncbi:MAG: xylose operon transcription regulator XylR, partial [Pirellulaceae bacterium]|nr:xylose operon transcription regulator XylR [Pirellulaceae bacterium]